MTPKPISNKGQRKGVILSLLAVLGIFLIIVVMFFVDIAYMQLTRTELQAATDAAAKAACESIDSSASDAEVIQAAIDVAAANMVGGQPLELEPSDVILGQSDMQADGSWLFNPGQQPFTAVKSSPINQVTPLQVPCSSCLPERLVHQNLPGAVRGGQSIRPRNCLVRRPISLDVFRLFGT